VSIVKETWGKDTKNIEYFSEKEDPSIPTINLGVPNTERGIMFTSVVKEVNAI
jgi:UDP-glucose:O-linked fucose beta-1,3-glucosyltransferase